MLTADKVWREAAAERLADVLGTTGRTQRALAQALGVEEATVSQWIRRGVPHSWQLIAAVAVAAGVSADYLLGLTDDPRPRVVTASSSYGAELVIRVRNDQLEEVTVRNVRKEPSQS